MEHLQHFGFSQDPFQNEPDLRFYFESAPHRQAQLRIERGLRQSKGLTVLTGDAGSGKTLVTRRIFDGLEEELFEVSLLMILPGAADSGSVLLRFARQLGIEEPETDRSALLGQIYEKLAIVREDGRHALLILDDAHVLEKEAVAEVGGLLNLEYEERRLVSMLWVGSPQLDVMLNADAGVGQRVEVRSVLHALDAENSTAYVRNRIQAAGGDPAIAPDEALAVLFKYSRGRPRLLNTLADNGLFEAYLAGRTHLDAADIESAAAELGIGPDPGSTYSELPMAAQPSGPLPDVVGSLTDPDGAGVLGADLVGVELEAEADLGALFDPEDSASAGSSQEILDLDMSIDAAMDPGLAQAPDAAAVADLDASFDSLEEATRIAFADDEAVASPGDAEATRIAFADEPPLATPAKPIAAPADEADEIDDLFVELLDD